MVAAIKAMLEMRNQELQAAWLIFLKMEMRRSLPWKTAAQECSTPNQNPFSSCFTLCSQTHKMSNSQREDKVDIIPEHLG